MGAQFDTAYGALQKNRRMDGQIAIKVRTRRTGLAHKSLI
jgi:hypothetical protein